MGWEQGRMKEGKRSKDLPKTHTSPLSSLPRALDARTSDSLTICFASAPRPGKKMRVGDTTYADSVGQGTKSRSTCVVLLSFSCTQIR